MKPTSSAELQWNWREIAVLSAVLVAISLIMWWRFLPLPQADLNFYTEPAYLLAKFGTLAGPGSQYVDLTYQKGIYNYPPGSYLVLAGWIKLFGFSADSLLGYTHMTHIFILVLLWALLRFRYGCSQLISGLILVSIFPKIPHGRPDLLACLFGIAAWLALPVGKNWGQIVLSGALAGATLLVSPGYGVGTIVTLVVLISLNREFLWQDRLGLGIAWLAGAGAAFVGITATVLTWQNSWMLAYVQFTANMTVRGKHVNQLPDVRNLYFLAFSFVPFVLVAILPAIIVLLARIGDCQGKLRDVALAFLGATVVWLALNKAQLLLEHHYLFAAKYVFLAVLCSQVRFPLWLRIGPLLLLSVISWYLFKADYFYLTTPLRAEVARFSVEQVPAGERAVDSLYFTKAYKTGSTLNYEVYLLENLWRQYRATIPPKIRPTLLSGLPESPAVPSVYVVSALSAKLDGGPPNENELNCTKSSRGFEPLRLLGRTWKLPANPYAVEVCAAPTN